MSIFKICNYQFYTFWIILISPTIGCTILQCSLCPTIVTLFLSPHLIVIVISPLFSDPKKHDNLLVICNMYITSLRNGWCSKPTVKVKLYTFFLCPTIYGEHVHHVHHAHHSRQPMWSEDKSWLHMLYIYIYIQIYIYIHLQIKKTFSIYIHLPASFLHNLWMNIQKSAIPMFTRGGKPQDPIYRWLKSWFSGAMLVYQRLFKDAHQYLCPSRQGGDKSSRRRKRRPGRRLVPRRQGQSDHGISTPRIWGYSVAQPM